MIHSMSGHIREIVLLRSAGYIPNLTVLWPGEIRPKDCLASESVSSAAQLTGDTWLSEA